MKKFFALAALFLTFALVGCGHREVVAYEPAPPPAAYSEIARQGYHDGIEAARRDIAAGRGPNVERHPRFRRPPVPPPAIEDYRHGFRSGYEQVFRGGAPAGY